MPESGWFSNTLKLRKAGFHGAVVDSGESMIEKLETLRRHKIIPCYKLCSLVARDGSGRALVLSTLICC